MTKTYATPAQREAGGMTPLISADRREAARVATAKYTRGSNTYRLFIVTRHPRRARRNLMDYAVRLLGGIGTTEQNNLQACFTVWGFLVVLLLMGYMLITALSALI